MLVWIKDRAAVVVDTLCRWDEEKRGDHEMPSIEFNWTLAPAPVSIDQEGMRAWTAHPESNLLMLFPQMPVDAEITVREGETEPYRGWAGTPDRSHQNHPTAPLLTVEKKAWDEMGGTYVTVLVPFTTKRPEVKVETLFGNGTNRPSEIKLQWEDGSTDILHWSDIGVCQDGTSRMIGRFSDYRTDASIVWRRLDEEQRVTDASALDGTHFNWTSPHLELDVPISQNG
jgi:hypothetical protein